MKDKLPIITALLALAGVALGGGMQYLSSRTIEFEKASIEYRLTSYRDFLAAQSAYQKATNKAESMAADLKIRDATLRIAIFSPKKVAAAVAEWLLANAREATSCPGPPSLYKKDISIYHAMRDQAFKGDKKEVLSDKQMAIMVHGCRLDWEVRRGRW